MLKTSALASLRRVSCGGSPARAALQEMDASTPPLLAGTSGTAAPPAAGWYSLSLYKRLPPARPPFPPACLAAVSGAMRRSSALGRAGRGAAEAQLAELGALIA